MSGPLSTGNRLAVPVSVGVIGLALIGVGQGVINRNSIQDDLTTRSQEALTAAGLTGVTVKFSGRDAAVTAEDLAGATEAAQVVEGVQGVRVAEPEPGTVYPAAGEAPATTPADSPMAEPSAAEPTTAEPTAEESAAADQPPAVPVGFTLADGTITLTGTVNSPSAASELVKAAESVDGWTVTDKLKVNDTLSPVEPDGSRLSAVSTMLGQAPVTGSKLVIQYNNGSVILRGTVPDSKVESGLLTSAADTATKVIDGLDTP